MREIRNFTDANAALLPYVQLVHGSFEKDTALNRTIPLMAAAGNPHEKLRVVHIAGTSGKTSTAYFMAALLSGSGKKVGLTVSPHIDSVAERVQVNGRPLIEAEFCVRLAQFLEIVETLQEKPTYFELLYAFSFWVFAQENVDYAVVETGMGGLYDPTNIAARKDKLCIITDIGFDHMQVLGHTLKEIAAQKAGIIHAGNTAIMYEQAPEVIGVVKAWTDSQGASLELTTEVAERAAYDIKLPSTMPDYQQRNWLLAWRAYNFLAARDTLPQLSKETLLATQLVQVPARMDVRKINGKTVIMDGAHNEQKMATFLSSFRHTYPGAKPAVLLALKQGKEIQDLGPLFAPLAMRVIVTTFNTSQDLPALSVNPEEIRQAFQAAGVTNVEVCPDQHVAYEKLLGGPEEVCIITGSFYLISQLRETEHLSKS